MTNNKSAISLLQELLIKQRCAPTYKFVEKKIDSLTKQFICNVSCKKLDAFGTGISKKEAKKNAAKNMLSLLVTNNKISLPEDTLSLLTEDSSSSVANEQSSTKVCETSPCKQPALGRNYVGILQQFCQQQKIDPKDILYEVVSEGGPCHLKTFTIKVRVGSLQESGTAYSKKAAKQKAAKKLLAGLISNTANLNHLSIANSNVANPNITDSKAANPNITDSKAANPNTTDLNTVNLNIAVSNTANLNTANLNAANLNTANLNTANLNIAGSNTTNLNQVNLDNSNVAKLNLNRTKSNVDNILDTNNVDKKTLVTRIRDLDRGISEGVTKKETSLMTEKKMYKKIIRSASSFAAGYS